MNALMGRDWRSACSKVGLGLLLLLLSACGGDSSVKVGIGGRPPGDGGGPEVGGTVRMPNDELERSAALLERFGAAIVERAAALSGAVGAVGADVVVELVELRPEDLVAGTDPPILNSAKTSAVGEFRLSLPQDTDANVCRFMLQVGSRARGTLTRAFVFALGEPIDIDFRSEATGRVILNEIPPADLCDFDAGEIRDIYRAVVAAPGEVAAPTVSGFNAVAEGLATADPGVQAAIDAALRPSPPTPSPTRTPAPPTATRVPATSTPIVPTNTPVSGATPTSSPTRTNTSVPGEPTATPTIKVTEPPTATRTATATGVMPTPTLSPSPTPSPSRTPSPSPSPSVTSAPPLGERVFTIAPVSPMGTGLYPSLIAGINAATSVAGDPLVLVAGARNANEVAQLSLKQDVIVALGQPFGVICTKYLAAGSSGTIDCDGGTAYGVIVTQAAGETAPPAAVQSGQGGDAGPGGATLVVRQRTLQLAVGADCSSQNYDTAPLETSYYTTANATATKGAATITLSGTNFSCDQWKVTDSAGMFASPATTFDTRAGGDVGNITRLDD